MDFRDSISAELPAPRDDEPEALRQDILDELADHLACAYRREILANADPVAARERVFQRFGDPAAVARRLWFDAMKGRIMTQRLLVVTSLFLGAMCLLLGGLTWFNWQQVIQQRLMAERALAEANRAMAEQAKLSRENQGLLIKQLESLTKAVENPRAPDWIPVKLKLVQGSLDGPPAVGVSGDLRQGGVNSPNAIQRTSDKQGMIDFGVVQPGDWRLSLNLSAGKGNRWSTSDLINVTLGTPIDRTIVCPEPEPQPASVKVRVDWPEDLANQDLRLLAGLNWFGVSFQPSLTWYQNSFQADRVSPVVNSPLLLIDAQNHIASIDKPELVSFWKIREPEKGQDDTRTFSDLERAILGHSFVDLSVAPIEPLPMDRAFELTPGSYSFTRLTILHPNQSLGDQAGPEQFDLIALASLPGYGPYQYQDRSNWSEFDRLDARPKALKSYLEQVHMIRGQGLRNQPTLDPSISKWPHIPIKGTPHTGGEIPGLGFKATPGQLNEWTIRLPDELVVAARKALEAEK